MPKARAVKCGAAFAETRNIVKLPCGFEKSVCPGSTDMIVRMHKKACKKCPKDAKAIVINTQTAGERPCQIPANLSKNDPTMRALAMQKLMQAQMESEDFDLGSYGAGDDGNGNGGDGNGGDGDDKQ